mmetsp:Transcript_8874/g.13445  ORF Transcript_8874/g.13445 Transcript_8874/m.13445 type:complete len:830 (+) Transcript_8874:287-2776(+)
MHADPLDDASTTSLRFTHHFKYTVLHQCSPSDRHHGSPSAGVGPKQPSRRAGAFHANILIYEIQIRPPHACRALFASCTSSPMLSLSASMMSAGFQSCGDLKSAFQSNECCAAALDAVVAEPLYSPVKDTITNTPGVLSQLAWQDPGTTMSTNFMAHLNSMHPVGTHTAQIAEATDAKYSTEAIIEDGHSGDTNYPFGSMKVLATVGEYDANTGYMLVGVPDGMGAYLLNDHTVRYVFQSESYGPLARESWPYRVNNDTATFTGSHIMYIDYNRTALAEFMKHKQSAAHMVMGAGSVVKNVYNLLGNPLGPRASSGVSANPHFSNTDAEGGGNWEDIMQPTAPSRADWLMQSLCSAHLEERHQWGAGLGVEDDLFITNEEWTRYVTGSNYTGIPGHVVDLSTGDMYATGVFTLGGFEKIVEVNCGIKGYVCFAPSGYNGDFGVNGAAEAARKNALTKRPDGTDYVYPVNVVPARLYVGKKGYNAHGEVANDFLSRNGLAYGQLYGFAANTSESGFEWRDNWHSNPGRQTGDVMHGAWYPIDWRWDGIVKNFMHDGSWSFQHTPAPDMKYWNAAGYDASGAKTEHNTPDPMGNPRYIQGSTAGYYGIYDFLNISSEIQSAVESGSTFPSVLSGKYTVLQGELDITAQIKLGGKGIKANGQPQTTNSDSGQEPGKVTFEDIDGLEWIAASDGTYLIIQEDSGNDYGERMFITKVDPAVTPTFYFVAMSGGNRNTRMLAGVGVPAGVNTAPGVHEFSGVVDLTGLVATDDEGNFLATTSTGFLKRQAEAAKPINEHMIAIGLQAHNFYSGMIATFGGDRGGQVYAYQPNIPN